MSRYFRGVNVEEVDAHFVDMARRCTEAAAIICAVDPVAAENLTKEANKFHKWRHVWDVATEDEAITVSD